MRRMAENATAFPPELSFRDYDPDLDGANDERSGEVKKKQTKFTLRKAALARRRLTEQETKVGGLELG